MKSSILEALQRERRGLEATPTDKEVKERLNRLKGKTCPATCAQRLYPL
jgi:hypothetical protein